MLLRVLAAPIAPPLCAGCGAVAGRLEPLCPECRRALRWLGSAPVSLGELTVWAPLAYDGPARALVGLLKFRGALAAAEAMAAQVFASAPPGLLETPRVLVPVPLHPARLRRRGFNQAERLAAALARRGRLSVHDCLERHGDTRPQRGRGRSERLAAVTGTVSLKRAGTAPPAALLVDDVMTTGATLAACAAALRAAGTRDLAAVAYARTPGR